MHFLPNIASFDHVDGFRKTLEAPIKNLARFKRLQ